MTTAPDSAVTILDHIDGITVPSNVFNPPVNEYCICLAHPAQADPCRAAG
jgi:hypothetical protein